MARLTPALLTIAIALSGCEGETTKTPAPEPATPLEKDASAPVGLDLPSAGRLPAPAALQPGFKAMSMKFVGWSQDSSRFVLDVVHAAPRWGYEDAGVASYELIQVHDALSGQMLLAFQRRRDGKPKAGDDDTKMWRSAQSRDEWKLYKRANPLAAPTSSLTQGPWKLVGRVSRGTTDALDTFKITPRSDRFELSWEIRSGEKRNFKKRPVVKMEALRGKETRKSLKLTMPFNVKDFAGEFSESVTAVGALRPYFSPSGKRLVWLSDMHLRVDNDAFPLPDARFFLRSVGPQVKIIDAGAGLDRARGVALLLEKNDIAVTVVETADEPSKTTEIYYRAPGAAAAKKAAALIGDVSSEKLTKPGWIDLIIFLGEQ